MRLLLFSIISFPFMIHAQTAQEPKAKQVNKELTTHNHTRIDPYFWMNQKDSKDVLNYIKEENAVSASFFVQNQSLVENLMKEFDQRIDPNEIYPPFKINGVTYQESYTEGDDYIKTHIIENGQKKLFIDENARAKRKSYYELGDWQPSPNNQLVAMSEDFIGRRNYTITFRKYDSDEFLKDKLEGTTGNLEWANDNKTVYYIKKDKQTLRSFQVYRHILGTSQKEDELIFEEKDERFDVDIEKSSNGEYIFITVTSSTTSEYHLIDVNNPLAKPTVFLKREQGHEYSLDKNDEVFIILTNKNAINKRLVVSKVIPSSIEQCEEFISHSPNRLIENFYITQTHIITEERSNGLEQVQIINFKTRGSKYIQVNEETYTIAMWNTEDYYSKTLEYRYNSMTTPTSIFRQDMDLTTKELIYQHHLLDKTFDPLNYESKRIWATANDGTKIPISIVYKQGTDLSKAPCLLYGYGSYGYTIPDVFSATRLSLLDRGFVYALAHIRGEKYMGEDWYQQGKFLAKRNTFGDFINAAEYLGMQHYCDKDKIYIQGGSAGGLLMGAVVNAAPYLFKGVIADVPFVDVVTTMLDETIPLTVGEYEEWGNPNEEEYYYYMLSYSPYDNVRVMDYPHMFITTGYHDSQVQYWEPLKWIAKLREKRTNKNILMLDCNMDAGHGGGSGRSTERLELAKAFAFILSIEGIR